jgi:predicted DNA-binding transcriptional regulator AlpA
MKEPLLNAAQVAQLLGMSVRWVHDHSTELGLVRLGRSSRFDAGAVESYVERNRVEPGAAQTASYSGKRSARNAPSRREILPPRTDLLLDSRR